MERGRFARICVEIDLNQPVVGKIRVRGSWHKVEYEGLHVICSGCGYYGHVLKDCLQKTTVINDGVGASQPNATTVNGATQGGAGTEPLTKKSAEAVNETVIEVPKYEEQVHGDWLVVTRKKKPLKKNNAKEKNQGSKSIGGGQ